MGGLGILKHFQNPIWSSLLLDPSRSPPSSHPQEEPLKFRRADFSPKLLFSLLPVISLNPATTVRRSCQQSAQSPSEAKHRVSLHLRACGEVPTARKAEALNQNLRRRSSLALAVTQEVT